MTANKLTVSPELVSRRARAGGQLLLQRCTTCECTVFPPRLLCPNCGTETLSFFEASRLGRILAATRMATSANAGAPPVIALVELAEGVTLMGNMATSEPCDGLIGRAVSVHVSEDTIGVTFEVSP